MQVDPISAYANFAARNALERIKEYAAQAEREILRRANYLRELGQGVRQMEVERAKNAELFEKFRIRS